MKKKEVVVHMTASKQARGGFFKRILLPALLCLFAAVLIWLLAVDLNADGGAPELFSAGAVSDTEVGDDG